MKERTTKKNNNSKLLVAIAALVLVFIIMSLVSCTGKTEEQVTAATNSEPPATIGDVSQTSLSFESTEKKDKQTEHPTEKATESAEEKRYELTDDELWEVASVVTGEAGAEPYEGKLAVAQCILQACEDEGLRPSDIFVVYGYTDKRLEPFAEAMEAVRDVFYNGERVTDEPIKYFYNPDYGLSEWHETQVYVTTIDNHKFFKEQGGIPNA